MPSWVPTRVLLVWYYFWYGTNRAGPGRPPKWVDQLVRDHTSLDLDDEPQQGVEEEDEANEEPTETGPEPNKEHPDQMMRSNQRSLDPTRNQAGPYPNLLGSIQW